MVVPPNYNVLEAIDPAWHTFITHVKYHPGMGPDDLKTHLNDKLGKYQNRIKINLVAVTWGHGDTVIIWQAKDLKDAKEFRDNPSTKIGDFTSMVAAASDIWKK